MALRHHDAMAGTIHVSVVSTPDLLPLPFTVTRTPTVGGSTYVLCYHRILVVVVHTTKCRWEQTSVDATRHGTV